MDSGIISLIQSSISYLRGSTLRLGDDQCTINTSFFVDHSDILDQIRVVSANCRFWICIGTPHSTFLLTLLDTAPWILGSLLEGEEYFGLTLKSQPPRQLTPAEWRSMVDEAQKNVTEAFERMRLNGEQIWASQTSANTNFIVQSIRQQGLQPAQTVLDWGCGNGRFSFSLAEEGLDVTGVDMVHSRIEQATSKIPKSCVGRVSFVQHDCRVPWNPTNGNLYDIGLCLYDVLGSFVLLEDNKKILLNLVKNVRRGGLVFISVMNAEMTRSVAKHTASIPHDLDMILALPPSNSMERSGEVFNPDFFVMEANDDIVYRKEQFSEGLHLPVEFLVMDRRFTSSSIRTLCEQCDLQIIEIFGARAGKFATEKLPPGCSTAKEIVVVARRDTVPHVSISIQL